MNTKKEIEKYFKSSASFIVENAIGNFAKELHVDSLELLSIDKVKLASFNEIIEYGQLYYCNFSSPFFCITNLSINKKDVYNVIVQNNFLNPTVFHIVSLAFIKKEDENLILFIFTENRLKFYTIYKKRVFL